MKVEYTVTAKKQLQKLDYSVGKRIKTYMTEVSELKNPKSRGKALTGNLAGYWRYRVGDYRIICKILEDKLVITVVKIGHRHNIYDLM